MYYRLNVKKLIISLLALFFFLPLEGQNFQKMVVWERSNLEEKEAVPIYTEFGERGEKQMVYRDKDLPLEVYEYDAEGRLFRASKRKMYVEDCLEEYDYQEKSIVVKSTCYNGSHKMRVTFTYQYLNEKRLLVEEKKYTKKGGALRLVTWRQCNYDERDSLVLERWLKIVDHQKVDEGGFMSVNYQYRSEDGQLEEVMTYENGKLLSKKILAYDMEGRLEEESYEDYIYGHAWWYKYYFYKKEKIWKTVREDIYEKEEQVFLDGQLVRVKRYDVTKFEPPLIYVGDYQYIEK